ncbi:MAG: hypothetical protein VYC34_08440, partial [Planctomycetota bacterium]|nr:hypothetical protein [Planctomycetota bacterium]
ICFRGNREPETRAAWGGIWKSNGGVPRVFPAHRRLLEEVQAMQFRDMILSAMSLGLAASVASAGSQTYFAQDVQFPPNGEDDDAIQIPHPNSDAAEADFINAMTAANMSFFTQDFESYNHQDADALLNPVPFGPVANANIDDGEVINLPTAGFTGTGNTFAGRYPISGDNYLLLEPGAGNDITITFDRPVNAIGFYGVDIGDFGGMFTTVVTKDSNGNETPYMIGNTTGIGGSTSGSVLFWGIIDVDNPFISIRLENSSPMTDAFAFDDFTVGVVNVIPTPMAAGLGLLGLSGIAAIRRRRLA